jgi:protein-S-isoprenylcysteine O-methyltransferase Ste14
MKRRLIDLLLVTLQFSTMIAIFLHPSIGNVTYVQLMNVHGPILLVGGAIIGLFGVVGLRHSLSIFPTPTKKAELVSSGIYKFVRHPMYTGLILIALSFTICRLSLLGIVLFIGLISILIIKSSYEENLLLKRFSGYETYRQKTGRFFVKL